MLHDQVIGTLNVESPEARGVQRKRSAVPRNFRPRRGRWRSTRWSCWPPKRRRTAAASVEAIHSAVALPVDDILNDAVNVMERYIGHRAGSRRAAAAHPAQCPRHQAGDPKSRPIDGPDRRPSRHAARSNARPLLVGRRILVVDADEAVRSAAHDLLERYHCIVETAHDGSEAQFMVRNLAAGQLTTPSSPTSACPICPATTCCSSSRK